MGERTRDEHTGLQPVVANYLEAALRYRENAPNEPPGSLNCHADRGGKRGGAVRVLLETDGNGNFPFESRAAGTRAWANIAKARSSGANAGFCGVLFQPSRMANDSYRLRVFLATPAYLPTLDVAARRSHQLAGDHPGLPVARGPMLVVKRRIDARYVRKSATTTPMDLNHLADVMKVGGLDLRWQQQFWTAAEFRQCFADAMAPDNAQENAGWATGSLYQQSARNRRQAIVNQSLSQLPRHMAGLRLYDQWTGLPDSVPPPAGPPNDANCTMPGRDLVDRPIIDAAVRPYMTQAAPSLFSAAGRRRRRWDAFIAANGGAPTQALSQQFYETGMSQAERDAVLPTITAAYTAARLAGFTRPPADAVKWIWENYAYKFGYIKPIVEMHVRKLMADNFEGVTFFHYEHLLEPVMADGTVMGRQCDLGGLAAVEFSHNLGLNACFIAWGHPTDNSRRDLMRDLGRVNNNATEMATEVKNGEITAAHEFGHFLHLPHREGGGTTGVDHAHYRGNVKTERCLMDYDPNGTFLCGVCAMRMRGWAWMADRGMVGLGNDLGNVDAGLAPTAASDTGAPGLAIYIGSPLA